MNGKNSYGAYAGAKLLLRYKANGQIEDVKAF